jgi:hypothetical protein
VVCSICGEIRAPGSDNWFGGFFIPEPSQLFHLLEVAMDKKEPAYARQAALAVKDWEIFQAIIRNYRKLLESAVRPATVETGTKR